MASYYASGYTPPAGVTSAEQVKEIQKQLTNAGYSVGSTGADGIWGKSTQAAYDAYVSGSGLGSGYSGSASAVATRPTTKPDWSSPVVGGTGSSYYSGGFSLPSVPSYDIGAAYDKSAEQYKAALDAAYNAQKAEIDAQAQKLGEQYDAIRNQAYVNARLNAIGNNEILAAKGLAGNLYQAPTSGVSETSRVAQDIGMRNDINAATRQEQNERDSLALELLQAGYARDVEYAKWMADMMIAKAEAEMAAQQQAFENQMRLASMYSSMYGGASSGVSTGSSRRSSSKSKSYTIPEVVKQLEDVVKTDGTKTALRYASTLRNSGISSGYVKGKQDDLNQAMNKFSYYAGLSSAKGYGG